VAGGRDGSVLITWEQASRAPIPWSMTAGSCHRVVRNGPQTDDAETQRQQQRHHGRMRLPARERLRRGGRAGAPEPINRISTSAPPVTLRDYLSRVR
jgi:hypothetical protein